MKNNNGQILIALLTGAAIGAGFGILYAPNKGSDTRKKIKKTAVDTTQDVSDWVKHAKNELAQSAHEKKEMFDKKLENALSVMSYKAEDILNALENKLEDLKKKNAQLQK